MMFIKQGAATFHLKWPDSGPNRHKLCFVIPASFFPLVQNDHILEEFTTKFLCAYICPPDSLGRCYYSHGLL